MFRMRVERDGVALGSRAADNRRGLRREMAIDDEEGRDRLVPREHVEQSRRRVGVRPVIESQVDGAAARRLRHLPHRDVPVRPVEDERERRQVHQQQRHAGDERDDPHGASLAPVYGVCEIAATPKR